MNAEWTSALLGGAIIGVAVTLMLLLNGRVTGVSGIVGGLISSFKEKKSWRIMFILGLFSGGLVIRALHPEKLGVPIPNEDWMVVVAGLLVGFGSSMGSGCTSGHGVCGISRLSPRSIVATIVFMAAGITAVFLFKKMGAIL